MKTLTIFTPSYNRAYCLNQCYESLTNQTNKDFIWLIIDDGSTDSTKELVDEWIKEEKIEIRYYFQENQGMHGAHNTAYDLIATELNVCIDSDDWMPADAVEKILSCWEKFGSDEVSGLVGLDSFKNGKVIGTPLPYHLKRSTLFNLYARHGVKGDKKLVYRSDLTKRHPYPLFEGEKYVGLAYKYYLLDQDFELLILNEVICTVEYLPDGSSRNMLNQYVKNPLGFAFYRKELMKLPFVSAAFKFRQAIHYVSSSMMSRNKDFLKESPDPVLTLLAIPLGALLYLYISAKSTAAL
ncbi:glycosyltransferase family A protein [Jeotgalibacillus sp. ET6]|uniref:glycosyltransferase family 2 protein n=1 Tax=Jeotgalibacillus sp. ET6 TaxID=3037260 RepID=UPI0024185FF6|nr:glycosyltransferase family A protein [Jeotgalibacillus sp. ET6]MDG5472605.1 glycosyltransferase family A protein [Jeotgalibacillus sp. ET6]